MKLSVLIPAIPSRQTQARTLCDYLIELLAGRDAEILMLLDNKKRSVGLKRDALVQAALGDYVAFVDDDDWVRFSYFDSLLPAVSDPAAPDVVCFDTISSINDHPIAHAQHSLANPNEPYCVHGFKRKPWQMHAWRSDLAKRFRFPDLNYGEDAGWLENLWKIAKTETQINGQPLYWYRYSDATSEAK